MALSVHSSSHATWDRTLPNPAALRPNGAGPRRSSSLLQHHISSAQFMTPAADESGRHASVPYTSPMKASEKEQDQEEHPRVRQRQDSAISDDSMTDFSSEEPGPAENPPGYCLCVPEPKIPRPRNAFILYRQHQHAGVVAQHPKLPNPDISKIIGEQWRQLSSKDKDEWKALAEQEKARHSQQFPDYRYRPRRNGKLQSIDGSHPPTSQPSNCAKCGGKTMNPPLTPHYVTYEQSAAATPVVPPRGQKRGYAEVVGPPPPQARQPSLVQVTTQSYPQPVRYAYAPRRDSIHYVAQPNGHPHPPPTAQQRMVVEDPEAKRRRMNASYPPRPVYDHQYYDRERPAYHRESIARPMPPPPSLHRPSHPVPQMLPPRGSQSVQRKDPSLTLPPLKTSAQPVAIVSPAHPPRSDMEGPVVAYPLLTKLKTLSSITRTLPTSGPISPNAEVRGIIIAIEGLDSRKVNDMTTSLIEQLSKEGKFHVKSFLGPNPYQVVQSNRRASAEGKFEALSHAKYFNFMSQWHQLNQDVLAFITHKPGRVIEVEEQDHAMVDVDAVVSSKTIEESPYERAGTKRSPISAISPGTVEQTSKMTLDVPVSNLITEDVEFPPIRTTRSRVPQAALNARAQQGPISPPPPPPPESMRPSTPPPPQTPSSPPIAAHEDISSLIPVAIIPHYQLTTVDTCAIALPITDNYDPLTHWRWHATLWRGCTGPDISVVIYNDQDDEPDVASNLNKGQGSGQPLRTPGLGPADGGPMTHRPPITNSTHPHPHPHSHPHTVIKQVQPGTTSTNPTTTVPPPPAISSVSAAVSNTFNVDVRLADYRAVIVKTGPKASVSSNERAVGVNSRAAEQGHGQDRARDSIDERDNENWEKAKRRVGFEVAEWMRR